VPFYANLRHRAEAAPRQPHLILAATAVKAGISSRFLVFKGAGAFKPLEQTQKRWALQAAEKLYSYPGMCQGTTLVVPQTAQNEPGFSP
jgi:hypothetical protein